MGIHRRRNQIVLEYFKFERAVAWMEENKSSVNVIVQVTALCIAVCDCKCQTRKFHVFDVHCQFREVKLQKEQ